MKETHNDTLAQQFGALVVYSPFPVYYFDAGSVAKGIKEKLSGKLL